MVSLAPRVGDFLERIVNRVLGWFRAAVEVGGRQFFLCFCLFVASTVLFGFSVLSEAGYLTLSLGGIVAYITGNQMQQMSEAKKAAADAKPAP